MMKYVQYIEKVISVQFYKILFLFLFAGGFHLAELNEMPIGSAAGNPSQNDTLEMADRWSVETGVETDARDLVNWIGKSEDELIQVLGNPLRIDKSAYGYSWWVYTDYKTQVIQFGINNEEIKTLYVIGDQLDTEPVQVGQTYKELNEAFSFDREVVYENNTSHYTFRLTSEDRQTRPLVKLNNDTFIQLYFDTFTDKLSSIRILTADTLLRHRPYEIEYRGPLPDQPDLSEEEWREIETGMEMQIVDVTNVMRHMHGLSPVEWEESVHRVAYSHSKDMSQNNYFSHDSLNGNGLKERLAVEDVLYSTAGENIAAGYIDALAAMEGWLNSEGHRQALLNEEYTHIGVGVYRLYYTQNFVGHSL